ncbi:MAG: L-serine ammonia-lyase, iron-sulfur-dependent, subunit alpha [Candidatus Heimdallarchaeum aukensis]|uniref:L-serine ammonia-lyase, iron-sulfur-dependent, subunit alpha n=1 Tax=Candidatus Heimdallarchaeum aukensis TaxID=2876573 RepID=A0A9Y1BLL2_9ARCH|nr:MAG: L-serine ammonia-lyase, iron-sulfur-dependent, subunit alpha [Candidatus Heimdallarchaeum aukensis]
MFESFIHFYDEFIKSKIDDIAEFIILEEIHTTGKTKEEILERTNKIYETMKKSLENALSEKTILPIEEAIGQSDKLTSAPFFLDEDMKEAVYWTMSIAEYNSGMGVIVACPTAGSSGVFPAVLFKAEEKLKTSKEKSLKALIVGGVVGAIIGNKATLSGSEGGCQAEVGVASAMSAAAITYLAGGSLSQIFEAISLCLINLMGLVCDPVAGLVISPCIKRNTIGVMNAFLASELALSGVSSIIPVDEVVAAMSNVGKKMAYELKETGLGGIANTPTAREIRKRIFEE